ncbi:MAG: hypothetical protein WD767_09160 [Alphaproteobacteria bacterium]
MHGVAGSGKTALRGGTFLAMIFAVGVSAVGLRAETPSQPGRYGICTKAEVLRLLDAGFPQPDVTRLCVTHSMPDADAARAAAPPKAAGGLVEKDPNPPPPPPKKPELSLIEFPAIADWRGPGARPDRARWQPAYTAEGRPLSDIDIAAGARVAVRADGFPLRRVPVRDVPGLLQAVKNAKPGDYIELEPGTYAAKIYRGITVQTAGRAEAPIAVGAKTPGSVTLKLEASEGFIVKAPYWIFENLEIEGNCADHSHCHHAFHVVGSATSLVLRNNHIRDFNAQLKVNAIYDDNPDFGLVEGNSVYDTQGRQTSAPVTKLNINSGNGWMVRGNLIADYEKRGGNGISYGAYFKANSRDGVFDGNVVACYMQTEVKGGVRLGLSIGGGGTGQKFCRDQNCDSEHTGGIIRNNIIVNCPVDVGVYLNRATDTLIHNNLILNTRGIDSRFPTSSVRVFNNILDARVKERDGGKASGDHNLLISGEDFEATDLDAVFRHVDGLKLTPTEKGLRAITGKGAEIPKSATDICGNPRKAGAPDIGPVEYQSGKPCVPGAMWK